MFFLKTVFCRTFQTAFRLALPFLPYREPEIIHSCRDLCSVLEKENVRSLLIVTDPGIVRIGLTERLKDAIKSCGASCCIYDQVQPNPTVQNVEDALRMYQANRCGALIAIGGGSSTDCAKAVGARAAYPKKSIRQMKGILRVLRSLPPLIAIPTTAGTGSEATLASVITDSAQHHKYALMSFPLIPHYAVLDAKLTVTLPPHLTATTGMDALTHAVEAYIGRSTTRQTRRLALDAVRLVFENIETACRDGHHLQARENMLRAAYMAGAAFSKSYVGYIHALAHSLGGQYGTPHGLANAVIMPYVLDAYGKSVYKKLHALGVAAGVCSKSDGAKAGAEKMISAIRRLNARLGIPETLKGIRREDISSMARHAEKEANPLYPVPKLMTQKELEAFYEQFADWS